MLALANIARWRSYKLGRVIDTYDNQGQDLVFAVSKMKNLERD